MATSSSGIDVNSIVTQLMTLEQRPLTVLKTKEAGFQAKISALGSLKSVVSALQTAAGNLVPVTGTTATQKFSVFKTAVSDASIASATSSSSAVAGTYTLEVNQLAKQHSIATSTVATPFSGTDGTLTTGGTLTIRLDTQAGSATASKTTDVTIADGATPEAVRDAINKASAGVSAVVINGTAGKQLVLTGDTAGSNQFIKLTGVAGLAYDPNLPSVPLTDPFSQSQAAQGSAFKLNGIAATATTNTVTTAIDGITVNLLKGPEAPATSLSTTLTISKDTSSLTTGVTALVKAYNDFNSTANSLGNYNATTKVAAVLNGDSTLRGAQAAFQTLLGKVPAELSTATLQHLSDVGVNLQKDGKLSVDSTKLSAAIASDFTGVANLVAAYGSGFKAAADGLVATGGLIAARSDGLSASIKSLGKQSDVITQRLTQIETRYRSQFTALDVLLTGMSKTSDYLTQQLANLPTYD